ncbi:TOX high mobility group box family member 4-A isoform X3 [Clupea harengus]|uniref:TOX high mobility group box family member 4-A isoform X3 n=1 Tax=Clupea harengus TaxID=7950 RepID=A0A6P8EW68_CLUHA|nr:TOX high mobility group box family member 4-A isoform X3 [Clupea harengus]
MEFPGGSDNYMTITGTNHPFLSSTQTFHTPSLGDEEFEIPPISLDPDSALTVEDVEAHFEELTDSTGGTGGPVGAGGLTQNAVVGGTDPSFASTYVNAPPQGLEHLSLGVMNQSGGSALLSSTLGVDLGHSMDSHFSSSSPMPIDVPLGDMSDSVLGHNQLTTIDHSELSAQLGLGLGGSVMLSRSKSPEQPLSATPSPAGSLQDEDMDDFRQSVLIDPPVSLSSPVVVSHMPTLAGTSQASVASPSIVRRIGGKPAMGAITGAGAGVALGVKKGRRRKDPNEPQKPVSAYALFFRDTQAAIKGQNPNATFGEVSKIVASMWDSLGEEQKQVYKRKTDAAKKEYLKALAAYRANLLSRPSAEFADAPASPPSSAPSPVPVAPPGAPARPVRLVHNPDQNTITNICASNIILDLPQVTTRSRTGALPATPAASAPATAFSQAATTPTVTKIIISKQMLQGLQVQGTQIHQIPTSMVTVIPAGVRALQPSATIATATRQPPPLQQMQHTPPPPRLQQMVHSSALPPLQAKPRVMPAPPPPLQIKIVPASLQSDVATPVIVTTSTGIGPAAGSSSAVAVSLQMAQAPPTAIVATPVEETSADDSSEQMEVEFNVSPVAADTRGPNLCVRSGCNNPAVESRDWDKEYCSNECVATHCRDIFMAWCSIRGQNSTAVK